MTTPAGQVPTPDTPTSSPQPRPAAEKARPLLSLPFAILAVVFVVGLVVAISVPSRMGSSRQSKYRQAASYTKTAVTQTAVYATDKGGYPTNLKVLREARYADVPDTDPWGNAYVLAPVLTQGGSPKRARMSTSTARAPTGPPPTRRRRGCGRTKPRTRGNVALWGIPRSTAPSRAGKRGAGGRDTVNSSRRVIMEDTPLSVIYCSLLTRIYG